VYCIPRQWLDSPVDDLVFEQTRRVPGGKFRGGEVRNLPPEPLLRVFGGEREIDEDAPHAFALEGERRPVGGRERGLRQRLRDVRFGRTELTGVDELLDLRQCSGTRFACDHRQQHCAADARDALENGRSGKLRVFHCAHAALFTAV